MAIRRETAVRTKAKPRSGLRSGALFMPDLDTRNAGCARAALILEQLAVGHIAEHLFEEVEVLAAGRGLALVVVDDDAVLLSVAGDIPNVLGTIEIDGDDFALDLPGFQEGHGLHRRRNVVVSLAADGALRVGRTEHGLHVRLRHPRANLVEIDVDEDVPMTVNLTRAAKNGCHTEKQCREHGHGSPDRC